AQLVDAATRKEPLELPQERGHEYIFAMDPGVRSNAWTFVALTKRRTETGPKHAVALCRQWIGSKAAPLSPRSVLAEIAASCKGYKTDVVFTDQWSSDALRDLAAPHGLHLVERTMTAQGKAEAYERLRTMLADGALELAPDSVLRADLLAI